MTLLRLATQYYNTYTNPLLKSADPAAYARKNYNIKNLSGALGIVDSAKSTNFTTLQNVDTFVKNGFTASGLDTYETLKTVISSNPTAALLSGSTSMTPLYNILNTQLNMITDQVNELFASTPAASSAIAKYASYLNDAVYGSVLDITA